MSTSVTFERINSKVLIKKVVNPPLDSEKSETYLVDGTANVRTEDRLNGYIIITDKVDQSADNGILIKTADISGLTFTDADDLIEQLATNFFFRVGGVPTEETVLGYTKEEIDALLVGRVKKVLVDNTQHSNTGNTTENTVLTATIPANSIGANGSFHITLLINQTNNANAKTVRVKFNGTQIAQASLVSCVCYQGYAIIRNRNSLSSQVSMYGASAASSSFGVGTSGAVSTSAFNTGADITVTVTIQNATGTDTVSLEAFEILAVQ